LDGRAPAPAVCRVPRYRRNSLSLAILCLRLHADLPLSIFGVQPGRWALLSPSPPASCNTWLRPSHSFWFYILQQRRGGTARSGGPPLRTPHPARLRWRGIPSQRCGCRVLSGEYVAAQLCLVVSATANGCYSAYTYSARMLVNILYLPTSDRLPFTVPCCSAFYNIIYRLPCLTFNSMFVCS